jgi:HAD superfamily hydrolase (TIGR01459 family)
MRSSQASSIQKTWPNINAVTQSIDTLQMIASRYDAIIFDQWGVLHNGTVAYPEAIEAITQLGRGGVKLGVLSNSGKRAEPNAARIAAMGFDVDHFDHFMTSGEALWQDMKQGVIPQRRFYPIERARGDAALWADGLDIEITHDLSCAEAILLMGLPDNAEQTDLTAFIESWRERGLPVYCSNPDRQSPRAGGYVVSPGALAFAYQDIGGDVTFYGKPHLPVFRAVASAMRAERYLMVGDSLEHDIAGAQTAGWDSLLIEGGLYADAFAADPSDATLMRLVAAQKAQPPTFRMKEVR